jgi:Activator of Hsp90 ATPase homolog 1-like protein
MTQQQQTISPVRVSVSVGLDQQRCFEVFTDEMLSWWPASHHIGETPLKEIIIEPFVGGRWYARHEGGEEIDTGVVTAWDAPRGFTVTWQVGADWAYHADLVTHLDVSFTPTAAKMQKTFEGPDAWGGMLRTYKDVAERAAS